MRSTTPNQLCFIRSRQIIAQEEPAVYQDMTLTAPGCPMGTQIVDMGSRPRLRVSTPSIAPLFG